MEPLFRGSDWYGAVVVRISAITPHPDPETTSLEIARVMAVEGDPRSGIPIVVKKGEFAEGQLAVYTGIDAIVPTANSARFGFLDSRGKAHKLKAKKLRGVFSEGLLTPARALDDLERTDEERGKLSFPEGRDLTVYFGITKFITDSEAEPAEYDLLIRAPSLAESSELVDVLFNELTKPEAGPAWVWITKERLLASIKAGACTIDGNVVQQNVPLWPGCSVKIKVYPVALRPSRPGGRVLSSNTESCPFDQKVPHYDLDPLRRWGSGVFTDGEPVVAREKIHGANARFMHDGQRLWAGTRVRWTKRPEDLKQDTWWFAADRYGLAEKLARIPGVVLFGEVFGQVQDLKYGSQPGDVYLAFFDALVMPEAPLNDLLPMVQVASVSNGELDGERVSEFKVSGRVMETRPGWLSDAELRALLAALELPIAPLLYEGPWDADAIYELRNGPSTWPGADHTREGAVIRPAAEREHPRLGRVVLKLVGEDYKLRR